MRNSILSILASGLFLCLAVGSGSVYYPHTLTTKQPTDEIIITPEFRLFLKENQITNIVLRTPYSASNIGQADVSRLQDEEYIYSQIERNLVKSGYTLRDRGLLNSLLASGITDYTELGRKIQVEAIIEITSIDFQYPKTFLSITRQMKNKKPPVSVNTEAQREHLDCFVTQLSGKIIIVSKGISGAFFTLYSPSPSQYSFFSDNQLYKFQNDESGCEKLQWWNYDKEDRIESIDYFSNIIVEVMKEKR